MLLLYNFVFKILQKRRRRETRNNYSVISGICIWNNEILKSRWFNPQNTISKVICALSYRPVPKTLSLPAYVCIKNCYWASIMPNIMNFLCDITVLPSRTFRICPRGANTFSLYILDVWCKDLHSTACKTKHRKFIISQTIRNFFFSSWVLHEMSKGTFYYLVLRCPGDGRHSQQRSLMSWCYIKHVIHFGAPLLTSVHC